LFDSGRQLRAFAVLRRQARIQPERPEAAANLALLYQRAGAHDRAAEIWVSVISAFSGQADRRWWLPCAAFALVEVGQLEKAEGLCREAIAEFPSSANGYAALSVVCERRFYWQEALRLVQQALQLCPAEEEMNLIVSKLRILGEMGLIAECQSVIKAELAKAPADARLNCAEAELIKAQGPSAEALLCWSTCLDLFPGSPDSYLGKASMLRKLLDPNGSHALLQQACDRWPSNAQLWQGLAESSSQGRDVVAAHREWQTAERLAPLSIHLLWARCSDLGTRGARSEAEALLHRRRATGSVLWRGRYEYAKSARELDMALECLSELRALSPDEATFVFADSELRSWRQAEGDLERAAEQLRIIVQSSPSAVRVLVLLSRVLVLLGEANEAECMIASMPAADGRRAVSEARLWADMRRSDWSSVNTRWSAHEHRFFLPALHRPKSELSLVGRRLSPPTQGGILAMSTIRNELPRLPVFLDHHRALGVDGFVIVDNGSTDGSVDFLAEQPDVRLYSTGDSFFQSYFGMRWINQLIDLHGSGWVLYVDADERLVFPGSEVRSLRLLTGYLETRQEHVVAGVMLDMFPAHTGQGMDLRQDWFDPPCQRPAMSCPYVEAAGGARRRLFGTTVALGKAPLINAAAGVRYLGSHHVTPAPVSGISAALLHDHLGYLFDAGCQHRMADEAARAEHSDHAVDRRRTLAMITAMNNADLRGRHSLQYEGTAQLQRLKIMTTTDLFETFCDR
jgi:tetratricopeptide (TPR) repeat protein